MMENIDIKKIDEYRWEIPKKGDMLVPGRIYGNKNIIDHLVADVRAGKEWNALKQIVNVACLPGIQKASLAMSDVHPGYGFPIGGVGAFDLETGVISVAGVGYDINCLSGDSKILHEFGYTREIKDFKSDFQEQRIKCANVSKRITNTGIKAFMSLTPKDKVYKVKTESGKEIVATGNHPFLTPDGMVKLKEITEGPISVYPFEGVEYVVPKNDVIVSEEGIRALPIDKKVEQTIDELKKRDLLPLKLDNPKLPYLLKLMGFVYGDGCICFTGKWKKGLIGFYAKKEDLEDLREDIKKLGFTPSKVYSRNRDHSIKTQYGTVEFNQTEESIFSRSSALATLLWAMGTPINNKTSQDYELPEWLFKCEKWQKRLFLAALFGAELSSPCTVTGHEFTLGQPVLSLNKKAKNVGSGRRFLKQLSGLLSELDVESKQIREREEYKGKDGQVSIRLRLMIRAMPKNYIKLWSKIGFEYNRKKQFLACAAVQYLRLKENVLKRRRWAASEAVALKHKGFSKSEIIDWLSFGFVNPRFTERSLYEGRKTSPRVAFDFYTFKQFIKKLTKGLGKTGQFWEKIVERKPIKFAGKVFDFNVVNKYHNFIANGFVVSNCGVRTLRTNLTREEVEKKKNELANALFNTVPAGLGSTGEIRMKPNEIDEVLTRGAEYVINLGYGFKEDLEFTEEKGCVSGAKPENVSMQAKQREFKQVGTLGSGNHYLEVQYVEKIFDENVAKAYGLSENQILISIHCGSRALGHQIGTDYLKTLEAASRKYKIPIREKELVCAPLKSEEGQRYFSAVNCGINTAFANRQALTHLTRKAMEKAMGVAEEDVKMLYDIGHNTAKLEKHDGRELLLLRKGSTRAFGPGREEVPKAYRDVGQPVLVGGTMGTSSYILHGTQQGMDETFGSACHGAGRQMSRQQAKHQWRGEQLVHELAKKGIIIKGHSLGGVAEEAPGAYKDVTEVVDVMHNAGIAKKVALLKPMISIKG
jgi:tRNA-splicing ligase RtcB